MRTSALEVLVQDGLRGERPPEDWLFKAWDGEGNLVDLIFRPAGGTIEMRTSRGRAT